MRERIIAIRDTKLLLPVGDLNEFSEVCTVKEGVRVGILIKAICFMEAGLHLYLILENAGLFFVNALDVAVDNKTVEDRLSIIEAALKNWKG